MPATSSCLLLLAVTMLCCLNRICCSLHTTLPPLHHSGVCASMRGEFGLQSPLILSLVVEQEEEETCARHPPLHLLSSAAAEETLRPLYLLSLSLLRPLFLIWTNSDQCSQPPSRSTAPRRARRVEQCSSSRWWMCACYILLLAGH